MLRDVTRTSAKVRKRQIVHVASMGNGGQIRLAGWLTKSLRQRQTGSNMLMLRMTARYQIRNQDEWGTKNITDKQDYSKHLTCCLALALSVLLICNPGFLISRTREGTNVRQHRKRASSGTTRLLALQEPMNPLPCFFFYIQACFFTASSAQALTRTPRPAFLKMCTPSEGRAGAWKGPALVA